MTKALLEQCLWVLLMEDSKQHTWDITFFHFMIGKFSYTVKIRMHFGPLRQLSNPNDWG